MIKRNLILLMIFITALLSASPFEVQEQNENELTVKFTLPEYTFESTNVKNYSRIICDDKETLNKEKEGSPLLPFFSEIVGLPVDGDIEFQIIDKKQRTKKNILISPVKKIVDRGSSQEYIFYIDKKAYKTARKYPSQLLEKGNPAYLRDRCFTGFNVNPFQYKANTKELLITTEVTFRIIIKGNKISSRNYIGSNNFIDEIGDSFFLNNRYSKKWRKEKNRTATTTLPSRQGELVNEIQFIVDEEGIYKITYEQLIEALSDPEYPIEFEMEFDWDYIDPRNLELSDEFGAVPIHFVGEGDGSFDPDDYIEFYGNRHYGEESYYDDFTSENVYTLKLLDQPGSRMGVENGGLACSGQNQFTIPESFQQTIHLEEQNTRDHLGVQYDYNSTSFFREDIWFWDRINGPNLTIYPFNLQYPHQSDIRKFNAEICLFSVTFDKVFYTAINHRAQFNLNSSLIDQDEWYGQTEVMLENYDDPLPNSYLSHGINNIYISLPGVMNVENEQVLFDYFELTYWREYKTDEDYIKFTRPQNKPLGLFQFELENFSNDQVSVYKIGTSYIENLQVEPFFETGGAPFKVSFQDSIFSENTEYYAVTEANKKLPKMIIPNIPSSLKDPFNSAKYIIITIQEFVDNEGLLELEQLWESQGCPVEIVSLEDIFDEFNHGIRSAQAIRDFLSFVYNNWSSPEITHVLLMGDGITDERDFSSDRKYNLIPFKNVWASTRGAIASDNWLACIVGDDPVADISISRINIWEEEQIQDVVNKSIHYVEEPNFDDLWHSRITMAAGGNPGEGTFFAKQSERIRNMWIPADYNVRRVYCNTDDIPEEYAGNTTSLINNINDGTIYLQFMGHGGGYVWADYNLFNKADVATLNNNNYPFVISLSCYGSAFNYPQSSCLGEELILIPEKGAIAHLGFTGYGYKNSDEDFGKYLTEALFYTKVGNIGQAMDITKAKMYAKNPSGAATIALVHGCALLGDSMIDFILPEEQKDIELNKYNLTVGDTLLITSDVGQEISNGKFVIYNENDAQLPPDEYYPIVIPVINDTLTTSDFIIQQNPVSIYTRYVKLFAYGDDMEVTGITNYAVGQSAVVNILVSPEQPCAEDSISICADFFDENGIDNIVCNIKIWTANADPFNPHHHPTETLAIPMVFTEGNNYSLGYHIHPNPPGYKITYDFQVEDLLGNITNTGSNTQANLIIISGPDLKPQQFELTEYNDQPAVKVQIINLGSSPSGSCNLKLYDNTGEPVLMETSQVDPIGVMDSRWEYIIIPLLNKTIEFRAVINENGESFSEIYTYNNSIDSDLYSINMFEVADSSITATSLDANLTCEFPAEILGSSSIFYINSSEYKPPLNQPDIQIISLKYNGSSITYEIGTLNESLLADTLGHFPDDKKIALKFYYNPFDLSTQAMENDNNFYVYRWEEVFKKWVYIGGEMDIDNNTVSYEVDRTGIYTILQNNDTAAPYIEANVEGQEFTQSQNSSMGQEFTHGGYISKNGIITFLLSDKNGIDIFNNDISLYLSDGIEINKIERNEYSISLTIGNLIQIPIKYQLNELEQGTYYLTMDCHDVNGNPKSIGIEFDVSTQFDVINFANYPNPVKSLTENFDNAGRTRFTYVLTDDADKIYLKIYTVSGRLVKTFKNLPASVGYHEFPRDVLGWDCRDKDGYLLANGVYFYRITAIKGNKKIEKTQKMAILK
ncbi:MAG: hypothetical protein K8R49_06470 [Candidatus Cloacimonetes bacterium]|nr:hypothetical protein [Candidatus Cloacimonadota bacterium]